MPEIIKVYKKQEEIDLLVDKIRSYSFDEILKHPHFEFSVIEKLTDIEILKETFGRFELIKTVELRENKKGQRYYSFNYELEDGTFVILVFALDKKPLIINGFHVNRNYKRFEKALRKNYGKRFIE